MSNKITLVTPPDDIHHDATRILCYDLSTDQSQLVSTALNKMDVKHSMIIYVANGKDDMEWVLDKKHKCSIIILNAESENQTTVGYLAAQRNSFYFGNLRSIGQVNKSKINDIDQIIKIMEDNTISA